MSLKKVFENVLDIEANALVEAKGRLKESQFDHLKVLFERLIQVEGSLIVTGVGKSGKIGQKIVSTFNSLGLPSRFLHPVEALHGDLGAIQERDVLVLISKSSSTEEITKMLPFIKIPKEQRIGLLGNMAGPLVEACSLVFDCSVGKEACINNQAPTTSSTLALAFGDALAVCYEQIIGLSREHFAKFHPAGMLGKALALTVKNIMIPKQSCALADMDLKLRDVLIAMTQKPVGACLIVDTHENLKGLIVEGDIRRIFTKNEDALDLKAHQIMAQDFVTIQDSALAYDAFVLMEKRDRAINVLPVLNGEKIVGVVRLHDLWKEGFS